MAALSALAEQQRIDDAPARERAERAAARPPRQRVRARWQRAYAAALVVTDTLVITAVLAAVFAWAPRPGTVFVERLGVDVPVRVVLVVIGIVVAILLSMTGSRVPRTIGVGSQEYRAVVRSTLLGFMTIALVAYVLEADGLHYLLAYGLIAMTVGLVADRWLWRRWLVRQRRVGRMSNRVLLVGSEASVAATARDLQRSPAAGLHVVGACTPSGRVADYIPGTEIAVSGSLANLLEALERVHADTVLISSANELGPTTVRSLSWALEPGRQHLIVAPSLTDIGGPRIHTRPVSGLPLVHVETPRYRGGKLYAKRAFDVVSAAALVVLLAPVLLAVAVAVRLSSRGPVFFRQERVGLGGRRFEMLKFRSMYVDAEERLAEIADSGRDGGNDVMFKMKDDPRVTRVGKVLRRFSLDELPQLFNVVGGAMSLVGPRPPLNSEVEQYADTVHRRFLVKPGITGLWQVSGRSDLDWDETVRLDLFYVENWTLTGDLAILLKTVRAVLKSEGAY